MKQVTVAVAGLGIPNSDSAYLERISKRMFDAVGSRGIHFVTKSPCRGVAADIDDVNSSQDAANAIAQGIKDSGGPSSGFSAVEVDSVGGHTILTPPVPE